MSSMIICLSVRYWCSNKMIMGYSMNLIFKSSYLTENIPKLIVLFLISHFSVVQCMAVCMELLMVF